MRNFSVVSLFFPSPDEPYPCALKPHLALDCTVSQLVDDEPDTVCAERRANARRIWVGVRWRAIPEYIRYDVRV